MIYITDIRETSIRYVTFIDENNVFLERISSEQKREKKRRERETSSFGGRRVHVGQDAGSTRGSWHENT